MNEIVGHSHVGSRRFPIMSGPCKGCGAVNYGISTSGPDYCGACARGVPPDVSRLRREMLEINGQLLTALLALQVATGHKAEHMTPHRPK